MEVTCLLSLPGIIHLEHHARSRSIIVRWHKFKMVKEMVDKTAEEGFRLSARSVIVVPPVGVTLPPGDAAIFEDYTPRKLQAAGIIASITVMTTDALTNLATKRWKNPGRLGLIEIHDATSLDEALMLAESLF